MFPTCGVAGLTGSVYPDATLDYRRPNGSSGQEVENGRVDLMTGTFTPVLNILNSTTTPASAIPGDVVCRTVTISQNAIEGALDSFAFVDQFTNDINAVISFSVENLTDGGTVDAFGLIDITNNSISLDMPASTFGGTDSLYIEGETLELEYCFSTTCPAEVNNSSLTASWGCEGETACMTATYDDAYNVNFNGLPKFGFYKKLCAAEWK